jgi:hypothetical protein
MEGSLQAWGPNLKHEALAEWWKQAEYQKTDSAQILNSIFRIRLGKA